MNETPWLGAHLCFPVSFDKQFLRDYLEKIGFDKKTGIELPQDVVDETKQKYIDAFVKLTGKQPQL